MERVSLAWCGVRRAGTRPKLTPRRRTESFPTLRHVPGMRREVVPECRRFRSSVNSSSARYSSACGRPAHKETLSRPAESPLRARRIPPGRSVLRGARRFRLTKMARGCLWSWEDDRGWPSVLLRRATLSRAGPWQGFRGRSCARRGFCEPCRQRPSGTSALPDR